jgi:hypothetical protein
LTVACWQAFEARDIECEFAEAKYIALAVFSMSQGFLTGIPIVAVAKDIPEAFYLILTILLFVVCMVVLLLIFLPKILMQRRYGKMSIRDQKRAMAASVRLSSGQRFSGISGLSSASKYLNNNDNASRNNNDDASRPIVLPRVNEVESVSNNGTPTTSTPNANSNNSNSNSTATVSESFRTEDVIGSTTTPVTGDDPAPSGAFVKKEGHGRLLCASYIDDDDDDDDDDKEYDA